MRKISENSLREVKEALKKLFLKEPLSG